MKYWDDLNDVYGKKEKKIRVPEMKVDLPFYRGSVEEGVKKQSSVPYDKKYQKYCEMLTCLEELINNSIMIDCYRV